VIIPESLFEIFNRTMIMLMIPISRTRREIIQGKEMAIARQPLFSLVSFTSRYSFLAHDINAKGLEKMHEVTEEMYAIDAFGFWDFFGGILGCKKDDRKKGSLDWFTRQAS